MTAAAAVGPTGPAQTRGVPLAVLMGSLVEVAAHRMLKKRRAARAILVG